MAKGKQEVECQEQIPGSIFYSLSSDPPSALGVQKLHVIHAPELILPIQANRVNSVET